ncbi:MAG: response regulator transcription factor [Adlercreutzia equolifaciens]
MRVLLVEDDHAIVRALTDLLEGEGFAVRSCATQDGACAALATDDFDIALLDVTLAQGNGFAVCAAAREAAPEMPVIFLTASDDEYSTVAGLDMGADRLHRQALPRPRAHLAHPRSAAAHGPDLQRAHRRRREARRGLGSGDQGRPRGVPLGAGVPPAAVLSPAQGASLSPARTCATLFGTAPGMYVSDNALNVYVKRLREKGGDRPGRA